MEVEGCVLPDELYVDLENDVWIRAETGSGDWTLGILSSLASLAGRFTAVRFRPGEGPWKRGQSLATLESYRFTGPFRVPVDARTMRPNGALLLRPKLLNDDPYGEGWVVRIRSEQGYPEPPYPRAPAVAGPLREKIRSLRIHCYPAVPDLEIYEIGSECSATLSRLDEEIARLQPRDVVLLVVDDPTAPIELVRWERQSANHILYQERDGDLYHFLIRKEAASRPVRKSPPDG
jgi:glycine cleavage system H protein